MASSIKKSLQRDEEIKQVGYTSLWFLSPIIFLGIILLPLIIGLAFLIFAYIKFRTTEFAVTNKRIIITNGLINKEVTALNPWRIESIIIEQTFIGKILNFGTIVIGGASIFPTRIENISNPIAFRKALLDTKV